MGVKISLNGAKVGGKVSIGNKSNIDGDLDVSMDNAKVDSEVKVANKSRIGGNLSASMDETTVNGGISVGNHTSIGGNATTRVNVEGNIPRVDVINDSVIGGSQYTEVNVSRKPQKHQEKRKEGLLAIILTKLFGEKKLPEPDIEETTKDERPKNTGKNQWRREDGTPYETYNPSSVRIVEDNEKTVITISKKGEGR